MQEKYIKFHMLSQEIINLHKIYKWRFMFSSSLSPLLNIEIRICENQYHMISLDSELVLIIVMHIYLFIYFLSLHFIRMHMQL
jgi:hypothetical protein